LKSVGETLAIAAVALAAVGAAAAIDSGMQQAEAAELEKKQYEDEKKLAEAAGAQEEAQRRRVLMETLATQESIRAGRGTELFGPGYDVQRQSSIDAANDDILTIRANALGRSNRYQLGASIAGIRGRNAVTSSYGSAASSLLSGARAGSSLSSPSGGGQSMVGSSDPVSTQGPF
jgi:hypothetical protein